VVLASPFTAYAEAKSDIKLEAAAKGAPTTVPATINYQGRLLGSDGKPLTTADYTLKFRIFDAADGGNQIWGAQIFDGLAEQGHGAQVPVVHGHFNVILGPVDTDGDPITDAFIAPNRFIEVTVGNGAPIYPRQQILSVPYAVQAERAATAVQADAATVLNGTFSSQKVTGPDIEITNSGIQTWINITGATVNQTSHGRPIWIITNIRSVFTTLTTATWYVGLYRDDQQIKEWTGRGMSPVDSVWIDQVTEGSHTYSLKVKLSIDGYLAINSPTIEAFEF
jgi:hypothetical protein